MWSFFLDTAAGFRAIVWVTQDVIILSLLEVLSPYLFYDIPHVMFSVT